VTCAYDSPLHPDTCEEDTQGIMKTYAPQLKKRILRNFKPTTRMHIGSVSKFLVWIAKVDSDFFFEGNRRGDPLLGFYCTRHQQ